MLQRIQTVYLIIVLILSTVLGWFAPLFNNGKQNLTFSKMLDAKNDMLLILLTCFFVVGLISLVNVFMYKNRKMQKKINLFNIFLNLLLFGLSICYLQNLSGDLIKSVKGIGVWLPWVLIVFLLLSNKAIQKDEDLVKSVDRIR